MIERRDIRLLHRRARSASLKTTHLRLAIAVTIVLNELISIVLAIVDGLNSSRLSDFAREDLLECSNYGQADSRSCV